MADKTSIEWTDASWNPVTGCTEVSPGCDHCYAKTFAERWRGVPGHHFEQGFDVVLRPERLDQPLHWRKPRRVFVNSMSDLFHDAVPDSFIGEVFSRMGAASQHTFQVLTKRHGRMRSLLRRWTEHATKGCTCPFPGPCPAPADVKFGTWPLQNVWLGVSVEDQKWADIRIPALLDTPAAVRWLSMEPLLGPVDLGIDDPHRDHQSDDVRGHPHARVCLTCSTDDHEVDYFRRDQGAGGIDWVVVGGESGPGARPMEPRWARSLRDQCAGADVPFFFKQWGEWAPNGFRGIGNFRHPERLVGPVLDDMGHREVIERMGKKAAGRVLDGRTWDEYPTARDGA